jgi:HEAT repeat protein
MKINHNEFQGLITGLGNSDPATRWKAVCSLAKYSNADWEGTPEAVAPAVGALLAPGLIRKLESGNPPFRGEVAKALGNISTRSPAVVPELLRMLQDDKDTVVRAEAARSLGKIGEGGKPAAKALAAILKQPGDDRLRGESAWALARVDPQSKTTVTALSAALKDKSGHVCVCAAEALWKLSHNPEEVVPILTARLKDLKSRHAAAQALYRIGPDAKAAVPALLTAAKDKDRLFHESIVMALKKIDPAAATKARLE